jgi:hypothetical protein
VDITCDSDGQINKFIDLRDVRDTLPLHQLNINVNGQIEPYYLGFFLMGAYQDIMGDLHNLFGRVNEVHVFLEDDEPNGFYIEEALSGSRIADVIEGVQYQQEDLCRKMKAQIDAATKGEKQANAIKPSSVTVSVLNATGVGGAPGVAGLADVVAKELEKLGYKVGAVTDAGTTNALTDTLIEYKGPNDREAAKQVSKDLRKTLGATKLLEMSPEVEPLTEGAPVAVVIGTSNSQLAQ